MDERLEAKAAALRALARAHGWETYEDAGTYDGADGVMVYGSRTDRHPDADAGVTFLFCTGWCVNADTNRVTALRLDGKAAAVFVVTLDDGTGRYWYGPGRAAGRALSDPQSWTGVTAPAPVASR